MLRTGQYLLLTTSSCVGVEFPQTGPQSASTDNGIISYITVKLSLAHVKKPYRGVKAQLHSFLISARKDVCVCVCVGGGSASRPPSPSGTHYAGNWVGPELPWMCNNGQAPYLVKRAPYGAQTLVTNPNSGPRETDRRSQSLHRTLNS